MVLISRIFLLLVILGIYLVSGIFTVGPDEQAAVLRFSAWNRVAVPGLHYRLPWPFEDHKKVKVTVVNKTNNTAQQDSPDSYMLTGDFNILSVNFNVLWYVHDIRKFYLMIQTQQTQYAWQRSVWSGRSWPKICCNTL